MNEEDEKAVLTPGERFELHLYQIKSYYLEANKSYQEIADMFGFNSPNYLRDLLRFHGIYKYKKRDKKISGGDGYVRKICPYCGTTIKFNQKNPSREKVIKWLEGLECPNCHRKI